MTATNRTKTFARRLQEITDLSYQQALASVEDLAGPPSHRDEADWLWPVWHRQVVWMACQAAAHECRAAVPGAVVHGPMLNGHDGDHIDFVMPDTSPLTVVSVTFLDSASPAGDTTLDIGFTTYSRVEVGEDVGSYALLRADGEPFIIDDLLVDAHWNWFRRAMAACLTQFAVNRASEAHPTVDGVGVLGPNCL